MAWVSTRTAGHWPTAGMCLEWWATFWICKKSTCNKPWCGRGPQSRCMRWQHFAKHNWTETGLGWFLSHAGKLSVPRNFGENHTVPFVGRDLRHITSLWKIKDAQSSCLKTRRRFRRWRLPFRGCVRVHRELDMVCIFISHGSQSRMAAIYDGRRARSWL